MGKQSENTSPLGDKFNDFEFTPSNNLFDGIQEGLAKDPDKGILSDNFSHFEPSVSSEVWTKIEKELHPERKKRAIIWWGAAACIALGFVLGSVNEMDNEIKQTVASNDFQKVEIINKIEEKTIVKKAASKELVVNETFALEKAEPKALLINEVEKGNSKFQYKLSSESQLPIEVTSKVSKNYTKIEIGVKRFSLSELNRDQIEKSDNRDLAGELFEGLEKEKKERRRKRNKISPYSGSIFASAKSNLMEESIEEESNSIFIPEEIGVVDGYGVLGEIAVAGEGGFLISTDELASADLSTSVVEYVAEKEVEEGVEYKDYKRPFTLGVLFERQLNNRLAIASGLNYTRLGYSYTKGFWKNYNRSGVENYLGIPLNLTYDLVKNPKIDFYPLIGAQVDFGMGVNETFDSEAISEDVDIKKPALGNHSSIIAGAGFAYNLTGNVSVYGQSVYQNYISNSQEGFFTENPSNYNVQAGFKFSF